MKYLLIITLAFFTTQSTIAQHKSKKGMDLSPEEMATIKTKKMTLALDLTDAQQDEIYKLSLENAKMRKAHKAERKSKKTAAPQKPLSKEERLAFINKKLDHKIAMKAKLKKILNKDQYAKWEKFQMKRYAKSKHQDKKRNHHCKA